MKTQPARTKGPKARVMYVNVFGEISCGAYHGGGWDSSILVIPCATLAQAKRTLPFWKLSAEQKVEAVAELLAKADGHTDFGWAQMFEGETGQYTVTAKSLLSLIFP